MALSSIASSMLAIAATITLLGGPAAAEPVQHCESNIGSPDNLKALKHGLVEGYLPQTSLPNSLELLPAPPAGSSTAYTLDVETAEASFPLRGTPRWDLAARDANLNFPAAASIFPAPWEFPSPRRKRRVFTPCFTERSPMPAWPPTAPKIITNDLDLSPSTINPCAHLRMMNSSETMGLIHQDTPPQAGRGHWC